MKTDKEKREYYSFWEELREIIKSPEYEEFVKNQRKWKKK